MTTATRLRSVLAHLWRTDAPLTACGIVMIVVLAGCTAGLLLDARTITGAPAWLKPAKFAVSIAVYTLTLAWVFTFIPAWRRTRRIVGWTTAVTLVLEIVIISAQAWRGTTSHFNIGSLFDGILFSIMGMAIVVQTLSSVAVAVALWRQDFSDRALGWALRLGLTITIVGASTGGLMTRPTEVQLTDARTTRMVVAGAHTVGGPDGGPGLAGTGWSSEHGDLRVPHFLGLHALQCFALLMVALPRSRWSESRRVRVVWTAAASYVALFAILLLQALRGESVVAPQTATIAVLAAWALLSVVAGWMVAGRAERMGRETAAERIQRRSQLL